MTLRYLTDHNFISAVYHNSISFGTRCTSNVSNSLKLQTKTPVLEINAKITQYENLLHSMILDEVCVDLRYVTSVHITHVHHTTLV